MQKKRPNWVKFNDIKFLLEEVQNISLIYYVRSFEHVSHFYVCAHTYYMYMYYRHFLFVDAAAASGGQNYKRKTNNQRHHLSNCCRRIYKKHPLPLISVSLDFITSSKSLNFQPQCVQHQSAVVLTFVSVFSFFFRCCIFLNAAVGNSGDETNRPYVYFKKIVNIVYTMLVCHILSLFDDIYSAGPGLSFNYFSTCSWFCMIR